MDDDAIDADPECPDDERSGIAAEAEAAGLSVEEYVATII